MRKYLFIFSFAFTSLFAFSASPTNAQTCTGTHTYETVNNFNCVNNQCQFANFTSGCQFVNGVCGAYEGGYIIEQCEINQSGSCDILPRPNQQPLEFVPNASGCVYDDGSSGGGGWGECGSCSTCGGPTSECVTDPNGACVWDPGRCATPPSEAATCYLTFGGGLGNPNPLVLNVGQSSTLDFYFSTRDSYGVEEYGTSCSSWFEGGIYSVSSTNTSVASVRPNQYCDFRFVNLSGQIFSPTVTGIAPGRSYISARARVHGPGGGSECFHQWPVDVIAPGADLRVTKTVSISQPVVDDEIVFTIEVFNSGPDTATNVVVEDVLSPNFEYITSFPAGEYDPNTGNWNVGTIEEGVARVLQIRVRVLSNETTENIACIIQSDQEDPDSTPGCDPDDGDDDTDIVIVDPTDPLPQSDLEVIKTVSNNEPPIDSLIEFGITVRNLGPDIAENIVIEDILDPNFEYVSHEEPVGLLSVYDPNTGRWTISTLLNQEDATLTITVRVLSDEPTANIACIISSDSQDPDSTPGCDPDDGDDDTDIVIVDPQPYADLGIEKTVLEITPDASGNFTVNTGDFVTFRLTATNYGPDATDATVTDLVDQTAFRIDSVVASEGVYDQTTGEWSGIQLEAFESATLDINVEVLQDGNYTNLASIDGNSIEENDENDIDTVVVISVSCVNCNYSLYSFWGGYLSSLRGGTRYEPTSPGDPNRSILSINDKGTTENLACTLQDTFAVSEPLLPNLSLACQNPVENGLLTSVVDTSLFGPGAGYATVYILNNTRNCTYPVGAATYKANWTDLSSNAPVFDEIENYNIEDFKTVNDLGPLSIAKLHIKAPFNLDGEMCYSEIPADEVDPGEVDGNLEGCTIGYWKNHPDAWNLTDYDFTTTVGEVFNIPASLSQYSSDTFIEALRYRGGSGVEGMYRNLMRQAVGALLNAQAQNYGFTDVEVIAIVNNVLANADLVPDSMSVAEFRQLAEQFKDIFDDLNNIHNSPIGC